MLKTDDAGKSILLGINDFYSWRYILVNFAALGETELFEFKQKLIYLEPSRSILFT